LVFYPTFYNIGAFPLAKAAPGNDINSTQAAGTILLFFTGWVLTRGANMQKFFFRTQPESKTFLFGLVKQETIPGTRILVSGWWGVSRHLNYFGEIVQALALSLPGVLVGPPVYKWLALLYPLYYVALFIPRQFDDDELCAAKYGQDKWGEYKRRVPWRIVPLVW
jgi:protein-S-isoprenylcysteine O-methyltransferase Ste14